MNDLRRDAPDTESAGTGSGGITWAMGWLPRGTLRWDLVTVVAVAVAVQVVFRYRADWASHVLAGGALVIVVDAVLGHRLGAWAATLGALVVLVVGVLVELTVSGPFDPGDVAFTLAGALVITGGGRPTAASGEPNGGHRRTALAWGIGLLVVSVYYRYGIRRGP